MIKIEEYFQKFLQFKANSITIDRFSEERTTGVFWVNPSETWVDVKVETNNVVSSLVNFVGGSQESAVESHFMSESGDIDVFILPGPKPMDVFRQYTALTGTAPLPPVIHSPYFQPPTAQT